MLDLLGPLGPILQGIAPIAVQIIGLWVEKKKSNDKELVSRFKQFVEAIENSSESSAKLRASAKRQRDRLDKLS